METCCCLCADIRIWWTVGGFNGGKNLKVLTQPCLGIEAIRTVSDQMMYVR